MAESRRIRVGDIVECDVKGRVFFALVTGKPGGGRLDIEPIGRATYHQVTLRQVVEVYRKARPRKGT